MSVEYDFKTAEGLARWHDDLARVADEVTEWAVDFGEDRDLSPGFTADVILIVAARLVAAIHVEDAQDSGTVIADDVFESEALDFRLCCLKWIAARWPSWMSDSLKRQAAYLDRQTKRRRLTPNAPPPGEA